MVSEERLVQKPSIFYLMSQMHTGQEDASLMKLWWRELKGRRRSRCRGNVHSGDHAGICSMKLFKGPLHHSPKEVAFHSRTDGIVTGQH